MHKLILKSNHNFRLYFEIFKFHIESILIESNRNQIVSNRFSVPIFQNRPCLMTGALAPFSYLVYKIDKEICQWLARGKIYFYHWFSLFEVTIKFNLHQQENGKKVLETETSEMAPTEEIRATRGECYKTFSVHDLQIFVLS